MADTEFTSTAIQRRDYITHKIREHYYNNYLKKQDDEAKRLTDDHSKNVIVRTILL